MIYHLRLVLKNRSAFITVRRSYGKTDQKTWSRRFKAHPKDRARLAEKFLLSLETLSDEENTTLWLEKAGRRDAELDANPSLAHLADEFCAMRDRGTLKKGMSFHALAIQENSLSLVLSPD